MQQKVDPGVRVPSDAREQPDGVHKGVLEAGEWGVEQEAGD